MPELPEVENICRYLSKHLIDNIIKKVIILNSKLRFNIDESIIEQLKHVKITNISRRSKYILVILENNNVLIIHLGMTGKILLNDINNQLPTEKHDHFIIHTDKYVFTFNDTRKFGFIKLLPQSQLEQYFKNVGIEPLTKDLTSEYLIQCIKNKTTDIKSFLLNSKYIAGIGNIYASEILFYAKINPTRSVNSLTQKEINNLIKMIKFVLNLAIEHKGSTLRDYRLPSDIKGNYQNHMAVYNNIKCKECKKDLIKIKQHNRSTYYCNYCQK